MPEPTSRRPEAFNKRAFFRDLKYSPHAGQHLVHESTARRRVVACGVRWGKTVCAAMEGLAAAMAPAERSIGWVVAPTYDLADRVFREIQVIALQHLSHRVVAVRDSDRRLILRNMAGGTSEIRAKSADNPVSLLGEGLDWLVVDEAARLKPSIWQSHLSQRLIDRRGWALLISTPRGKGYFFDLWKLGQDRDADHASWNLPSWTNPLLDRSLIEAERQRLPERIFRQEYGAEFLEGAGAVFRNVRECATGEWRRPGAGRSYYGGLDLAKVEDYTVLTLLNNEGRMVFADRFHRLDWSLQVARIAAKTAEYSAQVLVDSTGAGEPVFEQLLGANVNVEPYPFTQASKSALITNLSLLLEKRELILPRPEVWPEGIDELEAFEYSVTEAGTVRMSAPYGSHDDCVISLALAAWHLRQQECRVSFQVVGSGRWG